MNDDGIGRLEGISLRWARSLLIGTIALGCLAIVSGLLVAVGVWLAPDPRKPEAAPPPEPAKFTLSMAEKWSAAHPSYAPELEQAALAVDDPGQNPTASRSSLSKSGLRGCRYLGRLLQGAFGLWLYPEGKAHKGAKRIADLCGSS